MNSEASIKRSGRWHLFLLSLDRRIEGMSQYEARFESEADALSLARASGFIREAGRKRNRLERATYPLAVSQLED